MLIITEISNETRNELNTYGILCRNSTILDVTSQYLDRHIRSSFFISSAEIIENVREFKVKHFA